ncbi:FG-GAP-like repeat-containing protein [Nocardioides mesophilus]|uniref:VCBS repeat-containing protein n=1 Tax=Nocardioides mesophilus TaxID=433659 RepID=A0A7G9RDG2_9ACTN|nr:FG-GAP-like repeat-containing protein [Nocardioides mesophilus]QNN53637.1 VCBS repeat-containing protein [Nocardioides mesophilus]
MPEKKSRFVLLCQQALACAVVVLVAAPAVGVGSLELVGPPQGGAPSAAPAAGAAGASAAGSLVAADPVRPSVTEIPLTAAAPAEQGRETLTRNATALRAAAPQKDGQAALSVPETVHGYATVGVTWATGQQYADDDITVSVRSLADGVWSPWQEIAYDAEHGPDPGSPEAAHQRFGTDAVVVGDVDDVQVKAVTPDGSLPADMKLAIVDPGQPAALTREQPAIDTAELPEGDLAPMSATTTPTGASATSAAADVTDPTQPAEPADPLPGDLDLAGTPVDVTPKPQIFSRAQWGADERLRDKSSLRYFEVHAGFVHHTVNANNYTEDQVPSIIRGIYAYHTQSKGWSDIGYNFLVDRFGRIWEGRYGGVDRPVVGAHTLNYNDYAFAMSSIGNFETAQPSAALLDAYGRLFAWKLSLHGVDAGSTRQVVGDRTLPAINGHRDVGQTACPGKYLYAKIPTIRAKADAYQHPFTPRQRDADVSGNRWPDLVVRNATTQQLAIVQTGGQVGFEAPTSGPTLSGTDLVTASKDLTGDGRADVLARDASTKSAVLLPGTGTGSFGAAVRTTNRFAALDQLVAVGDLNQDGKNDVIGRQGVDHRLLLFRGLGDGRWMRTQVLAEDWSGYDLTAAAGDLDRNGTADLLARDTDGRLWLVPGTGKGALGTRVALPGTWTSVSLIAGLGDVTNDGRADLVARKKDGQLWIYPGTGTGTLSGRLGPYSGFAGVDTLSSPGQVTGSARHDLVGRTSAGRLVVFANRGTTNVRRTISKGQTLTDTNLLLSVGDWNGDGRNDLMTRRASDGAMLFRAGDGSNHFAEPVVAGTGWGSMQLLTAVGDITGDGYPDLMGQPSGGSMRIYPGNGASGFRPSYAAYAGISASRQVGAGLWDGDGSPDSILRRSDGSLWMYPGNGPGGLTGGQKVGGGSNRYDWMVGAGDVDGDGRPDVIGREAATGDLWLLPGASGGKVDRRRYIAGGFKGYDLAG